LGEGERAGKEKREKAAPEPVSWEKKGITQKKGKRTVGHIFFFRRRNKKKEKKSKKCERGGKKKKTLWRGS